METFCKIEKKNLLVFLKDRAKSLGLSSEIIKQCPLNSKCLCFKGLPCSRKQECFIKYKDRRKANTNLSTQELNKLTKPLIHPAIQCGKAQTKRRLSG